MKRTVEMIKVALVGMSVLGLVWFGASRVDTVSHNMDDREILYINGEFVEQDPYADWNVFSLFGKKN